jgi:hypothetical protein
MRFASRFFVCLVSFCLPCLFLFGCDSVGAEPHEEPFTISIHGTVSQAYLETYNCTNDIARSVQLPFKDKAYVVEGNRCFIRVKNEFENGQITVSLFKFSYYESVSASTPANSVFMSYKLGDR